jgi:4-hydroxy-tetrahydrodipicolinate reductase
MIRAVIIGAGRMGREILNAIEGDLNFIATGVVDAPGKESIGSSVQGVLVTDNIFKAAETADVIIDFSGAHGTASHIKDYKALNLPLVIGSTGFSDREISAVTELSGTIPLLLDSNMSVGVNIMLKLVETASHAVGDDFDTEILEAHHRYKKDAPSGTALALAKAASRGEKLVTGERLGERSASIMGVQALRGGDTAGEHTVFYFGEGERLEITHRAASRSIFAKGALRAAKWLVNKPAGLYKMKDVLGLS